MDVYFDIGQDWLERKLREGSYALADGRRVHYQDAETLRDAADLYAVLEELHGTGSPNLENMQARHILDRLQTGGGLGELHLGTLRGLLAKHASAIVEHRRSPDRKGQDPLAMASDGSDSRIEDPAKTQEAASMDDDIEGLLGRLREDSGLPTMREGGLLERLGLDPDEYSATSDTERPPAVARDPKAPLPLREAVVFGQVDLLDAVLMDEDARRAYNQQVPLLEALGIDADELGLS